MPSFRHQVRAFKLALVQGALDRHRGNALRAAKELQMPRSTLMSVLESCGGASGEMGRPDDAEDDPPLAFAIASEERLGLDRQLSMTFYACWTVEAIAAAAADTATVAFALEADTACRLVDRVNQELRRRVAYA